MCPPYGLVFSSKGCLILCELSSPPPPAPRSPRPPRPQPRLCELGVPCQTSTAIMWAQCSLPDSNRDPVSSVFRAGPVSHSCDLAIETCRSYGGPWLAKGLRHGGQALPECWPECTPHDCTAFVGPVHFQICQASSSPALGGTDPSAAAGTRQGSSQASCGTPGAWLAQSSSPTAMMWAQRSLPDLNRDHVRSVLTAHNLGAGFCLAWKQLFCKLGHVISHCLALSVTLLMLGFDADGNDGL